jgi:hypothetical protein
MLSLHVFSASTDQGLILKNNTALTLNSSNNNFAIKLKAPNALSNNFNLVLPSAQGATNDILKNDGAGNLSWGVSGVSSIVAGTGLNSATITNAGTLSIDTTTGTTTTTSNNSGLEADSTGISLLRGCADGQVLKWRASSQVWQCGTARATYHKIKTTNYTNNTTTLSDVADMSFEIGANENWYFEMNMHIKGDSQDDSKARINCPVNATGVWSVTHAENASTDGNNPCDNTSANIALGNNSEPYLIQGLIQNGATAGTLSLQMKENRADDLVNGITIFKGSVLRAWRLSGADYAEIYYTHDSKLVAGSIVALDPDLPLGVKLADKNSQAVLGVISTLPGKVIGSVEGFSSGRAVPLALAGRVPVKVSSENGVIKAGDRITTSTILGVGVKATKAGQTIGIAMTGFSGKGIGEILLFVSQQYFAGMEK